MSLLTVVLDIFRKLRTISLLALVMVLVGCGGSGCPTESASPYVWFAAPVEGNPDKVWVQFRTRYVSSCNYNLFGTPTSANYSDSRRLRRSSANDEAKYSVTGRTVETATFYSNVNGILLTVSPALATGTSVNVTVRDLQDESSFNQVNNPRTFSVTYRTGSGSNRLFAEYHVYNGGFGNQLGTAFVGNIDNNWGTGNVAGTGRSDNVAIRWSGFVQLAGNGNYSFQTRTDDGVRFNAIDMSSGNWLINDWENQSATDNSTPIFPVAGGFDYSNARIPIVMEYYEGEYCYWFFGTVCNATAAEARLRWSTPSSGYTAIPSAQFFTGMAMPSPLPVHSLTISDISSNPNVCTGASMKVTLRNEDGDPVTGFTGTLNLSNSRGRGDWTLDSGAGTLNNGTANDGLATYAFSATDNGTVTLRLNTRRADTLTATASVASTTVSATTPSLTFVENAFVLVPNATHANDYVAGRPHDLEIQQVQRSSSGSCEINANYEGARALRFWYANEAGTWSAPRVGSTTLTTVKPSTTTNTVTFTAGRANVSFLSPDVGQFTLNVVDDGTYRIGNSSNEIVGSLSSMIVRPFGLRVAYGTALNNLQASRSTTANATQSAFMKAGEEFSVRVDAVAWEAGDDANNDGIPEGHGDDNPANNADLSGNAITTRMAEAVSLSRGYVQTGAAGTALTTVTGITAASWSSGTAGARVYFDDVGEIEIRAQGSFLGRAITGRSGYIGRFTADRFDVQVIPGVGRLAHGHGTCSYTYRGESFGYSLPPTLTVTAKTARNTTAASYVGAYWKLASIPTASASFVEAGGATVNRTAPASPYAFTGINAGAGTLTLSGDTFVIPKRNAVFTQNAGDPVLSPSLTLTLSAAALTETATAGDTACYRGNSSTCQPFSISSITGTEVRDGCMQLTSASTVGRNPVTLPLEVVYYSGGRYIRNTDETASCLSLPAPVASQHSGDITVANLQSLTVSTLTSGAATVTANLSASAPLSPVGAVNVTVNAPAYLECRDTGASAQDPVASANWQSGVTNPVLRVQETWR